MAFLSIQWYIIQNESIFPFTYSTSFLIVRSMWSDTGNEDYYSRGDILHKKNLDSFNLAGPNMSQSRFNGKKGNKDGFDTSRTASTVSS